MSSPKHGLSVEYNNQCNEIVPGRDESSDSDSVARRSTNEMEEFEFDVLESCSASVVSNYI